jgi:hypothetical protein
MNLSDDLVDCMIYKYVASTLNKTPHQIIFIEICAWFKNDLHFTLKERDRTSTLVLNFMIFSLYINTYFPSSWQVTDASSIKVFTPTVRRGEGTTFDHYQFESSALLAGNFTGPNTWRSLGATSGQFMIYQSIGAIVWALSNLLYVDKCHQAVGLSSLTVFQNFTSKSCGVHHCEASYYNIEQ